MPRRLKELAEFKTVRDLIINNYVEYRDNVAFIRSTSFTGDSGPSYDKITYEQFYRDVKALGTFIMRDVFLSEGKKADGDADSENTAAVRRANFAVIGDNSYFCALASLTVMCGIGTALPLGRSTSQEKINEIFSDLNIKHAFVHPAYAHKIPDGVKIYSLDPVAMQEYITLGENDQDATDLFLTSPISDTKDICLALSTNGEKGRRKFARLTNRNLSLSIISLQKKIKITHSDSFVSILPLALYSEFVTGLLFPLSRGASIIYGDHSLSNDPSEILKVHKPTMLVSAPCFIESVYSAIWSNLQKNGKTDEAMNFIRMVENAGQVRRGIKQSVFSDVTGMLGGNLKAIISVSDSLSIRARSGMKAFGIPIIDVYGMAECPVISIKLSSSDSDKTLGDPIPYVSISINSAEHDGVGLIRIRGEAVADGYCNERHNRKYVIRDGWMNTGDVGTLTSDGKVHLIGKKTTAFESAKQGRMIYPEQLEAALCSEYNIAEAMVFCEKITNDSGETETVICAKIRPEISFIEMHGTVAAKKMVRDTVDKVNSILLPYKKIAKYSISFEKLGRTPAFRLERWAD